jgi:WD40 repeat protein
MADNQLAQKPEASDWAPQCEFIAGPAPVIQISFHPDGRQLLVATGDRGEAFGSGQRLFASSNTSLWKIGTEAQQRWKHDYQSMWVVVRFSPDGKRGFCGAGHGLDWIDTESLQLNAAQPPFKVQGSAFVRILSPDGRLVVWEDESESPTRRPARCRVQGTSTQAVIAEISLDAGSERIAGLHAGRNFLLFERSNTRFRDPSRLSVRDLSTQADIATIQCAGFVIFTEISPSGRLLAVAERIPGASDDTAAIISVWDTGSGKKVGALEMPQAYVWAVAFSSDETLLAVGSERSDHHGAVEIFELATSKRIANWTFGKIWGVTGLGFSPEDKYLAVGTADGKVRLYESPISRQSIRAD